MPLSLTCDCGARFEVDDALAGQNVSCPECQAALKAPAARRPVQRTSNLALASFLLAIVGAFTVVGTVAAVVLGLLGAAAILRDRERLGGLGFAVTGVVLGAAFTALTLFSLSQIEFFGAALRRGQMVGQLDKKVDPNKDVEIDESGFRITKPMTWWRANKDFSFLAAQPLLRDDAQLLLVQPDMGAFVDVQVEPAADVGPIDDYVLNRIKPDSVHDNEGAKPHEGDAENLARIEERKVLSSRDLPGGDGVREAHELTLKIKLDNKEWTMLVRTYRTGRQLFIVRGFLETRTYEHVQGAKDGLLKALDTFKVTPGS